MTSFTSLLVATDFSVDGNHAVRRAALLAHEHGARLHILHVLNAAGRKPLREWLSSTSDLDLEAAQARDALRRLAVEISGAFDVTASVEVAVGDPFETLMHASEHVDLVVLGRRGHGRLKGWLEGRTVDRMVRICRRPVLVVRTAVQGSYRRVLVPIDFSASSDAAIRVADRIRRAQRLHLFHAIHSQREAVLRDADVPEHLITETRLMEDSRAPCVRMKTRFCPREQPLATRLRVRPLDTPPPFPARPPAAEPRRPVKHDVRRALRQPPRLRPRD